MNEGIFFLTALLDLIFIVCMLRLGKAGIIAAIVINTILISAFGAKLITVFGFVTNTGNVFYASTFAASAILAEHYGRKEAYRAVWIGFCALSFFIVLWHFTNNYIGIAETQAISDAIRILFREAPRVAIASMSGYILSQHLAIWLFDYFYRLYEGRMVWMRTIVSAVAGQALDSAIFFSIAFSGQVESSILMQAIAVGFLLKIAVAVLSIPVLYGSYRAVTNNGDNIVSEVSGF